MQREMNRAGIIESVKAEAGLLMTLAGMIKGITRVIKVITVLAVLTIAVKEEMEDREIDRKAADRVKSRAEDSRRRISRHLSRVRTTSAETIRTKTRDLKRILSTKTVR